MDTDKNDILVFKTNISTLTDKQIIQPVLDNNQNIKDWNVDTEDVDKVLRVITTQLQADDIITIIKQQGYLCSDL